MKPRPGRGHMCVQLNPSPVTGLASELCSAPSQGRDTQFGVVRMLGVRLSKMGQEATKVGTGRLAKGLVRLAKGLDFTWTVGTSSGGCSTRHHARRRFRSLLPRPPCAGLGDGACKEVEEVSQVGKRCVSSSGTPPHLPSACPSASVPAALRQPRQPLQ